MILKGLLALRAGYDTSNDYSLGVGVEWNKVRVDYAVVTYDDVGDTHRLAVLLKL